MCLRHVEVGEEALGLDILDASVGIELRQLKGLKKRLVVFTFLVLVFLRG